MLCRMCEFAAVDVQFFIEIDGKNWHHKNNRCRKWLCKESDRGITQKYQEMIE